MGRESQYAFYAADTGAECALYWDVRHNYFAPSPPAGSAMCDEQTLTVTGPYTDTRVKYFEFNPNGKCSKVTVKKCDTTECDSVNYPNIHTIIRADGYNTSCETIASNQRALQRSVELHY